MDFTNFDPLSLPAVLNVAIPKLPGLIGERKVREAFFFPDGKILMIPTDKIGAFDQPHVTEHGEPAHYPGKGAIIAKFSEWGFQLAGKYFPTDYCPIDPYLELIPVQYRDRASVKVPYKKPIPVEFVTRSSCEGSMAKLAAKGELICGQEIPSSVQLGHLLPRPFFTPTDKAPKGQKDKQLTLREYYELIGNKDVGNFLYGMAVLLHLLNRAEAVKKNLDRPDQKIEVGEFDKMTECHHLGLNWDKVNAEAIFSDLCVACGFNREAWRLMPMFDISLFHEFAKYNFSTYIYRLIDEYAGTDDGRYRTMADTQMGRRFVTMGAVKLARVFLQNYLCKERFRIGSRRTGLGDYDKPATDVVTISDSVLLDTADHNLMALLMLAA